MKLDPNCVRDILLELEKLPYQKSCTISDLGNVLSSYQEDELSYSCFKLAEANYIDITSIQTIASSGPEIRSINDITFYGHEFLNNIRSDTVWDDVKAVGAKIGANSVSAFTQIASGVVTALIKAHLNL